MPEPINTMKCPFRQDAQGEFCDCIGKTCMAYFEFDRYQYDTSVNTATNIRNPRSVPVSMCKRMPQPITYPAGCAI